MRTIAKTLMIMICTISIGACNPFKVTDPNDPQFNSIEFRFNDYQSGSELRNALEIMFPPGTERKHVEEILLDHAKLKVSAKFAQDDYKPREDGAYTIVYRDKGVVSYGFSSPKSDGLRTAQFTYSQNNKVLEIKTHFFSGINGYPFFFGEPINKGETP